MQFLATFVRLSFLLSVTFVIARDEYTSTKNVVFILGPRSDRRFRADVLLLRGTSLPHPGALSLCDPEPDSLRRTGPKVIEDD